LSLASKALCLSEVNFKKNIDNSSLRCTIFFKYRGEKVLKEFLQLSDGRCFQGRLLSGGGCCEHELVYVTSYTGYCEVVTDPSYRGQIVVFAAPHVGITGMQDSEKQASSFQPAAIVVRTIETGLIGFPEREPFLSFLQQEKVPVLADVDTRALIRHIQKVGKVTGKIVGPKTTGKRCLYPERSLPTSSMGRYRVAVVDFGMKSSLIRELKRRGLACQIFSQQEIQSFDWQYFDGVVLSSGPHDPREYDLAAVNALIQQKIPILGVCLGHQLLSLAMGAKIERLLPGHHGSNHPVVCLHTNKVYITSQNHNFAVVEESLPASLLPSFRSLIGSSLEGVIGKELPLIGVQFHPEGAPGPQDTSFILDSFVKMIEISHAQR
jgi:carbamoyl-phosphate synthase small subunit